MLSNAVNRNLMRCPIGQFLAKFSGEPINFIKTSFALRIVTNLVPLNINLLIMKLLLVLFCAFDEGLQRDF